MNVARVRNLQSLSALLTLSALLPAASCMVGPDFSPPAMSVPAAWTRVSSKDTVQPPSKTSELPAATVEWWKVFDDRTLDALVERAVRGNLDLRQAEARIRQARANRQIALAGIFPQIDASADYRRSDSGSGRGVTGVTTVPGGIPVTDTTGVSTTTSDFSRTSHDFYQAGFDASWEIDIFGGTRRNIEAAGADLQAAIEARNDTMVTLLSEVARSYIELRGFQRELAVAQDNLVLQEKSVSLSRRRFEAGFVSFLDVANAEAQVASTRATIPLLNTSVAQTMHNISLLLGAVPAAVITELAVVQPIPDVPAHVPAGLPSDLLRRRPDIRTAEAQVHAAVARIGVATADLYPRFSLTGAAGFASSTLSDITHNENHFWSIAPGVRWPLFAGGRIRGSIRAAEAEAESALLTYQQTVLRALKEVEDALVAYANEQERRAALFQAVEANRDAVRLATDLYTQGQTDFLNVIAAKAQLFAAEDALVQSERAIASNLIALYKALGGGWNTVPTP